MRFLSLFLMYIILGCSGPTFTNVGNGVGVPDDAITAYASKHSISREEARARLLVELEKR